MSDCVRTECDECLPLFRYFVNQQPVVIEPQQVISPDCPVGYECVGSGDPVIIPERTTIPDLPPYDPDIDPDEELPTIIPYDNLKPVLRVSNIAMRADCQDLDPSYSGTASFIVAAGIYTLAYSTPSERATAQAYVNYLAFVRAKLELQNRITAGLLNCTGWLTIDNSDDCATQGGKIINTPTKFDFGEMDWDYDVSSLDGEDCGLYTRVDTTRYKTFGPYTEDMTVEVQVTGTWFESSPFFANAIMRVCLKEPAQLGSTTPPRSSLDVCSGVFFPATSLLSWGGAEPAFQQTSGTLPAGDQIIVCVGLFAYGQNAGPPANAWIKSTGTVVVTPVP